jgi:hypothetical protein
VVVHRAGVGRGMYHLKNAAVRINVVFLND